MSFSSIKAYFLSALVAAATLTGCSGLPTAALTQADERTLSGIAETMSIRQKIGQRFIGWIPASGISGEVRDLTLSGEIGGFIIYRWNFETIEDVKNLTAELQRAAREIPLFIAADQEGGRVAAFRFDEFVELPAPFHLAENLTPEAIEAAAYVNAVQLQSIGVNMNLAPVLDLYPVADSTIIGDRSFGDDVESVSAAGTAFVRGTLRGGVLPVIKHFPGHGISTIDSHGDLPVISSFDHHEFERHLQPFRAVIAEAAPAVMPAHILYPGIDPDFPVTLSHRFIGELLREELDFPGLIVSDGLSMGALSKHYSLEDTLIRCFRVGIDVILVHSRYSIHELIDTVVRLVERGEIPVEQIDSGVLRVLRAKKRYIWRI